MILGRSSPKGHFRTTFELVADDRREREFN